MSDELEEHMARIARELRSRAKHGLFDGRAEGMSGWLKNPDYERCWHLSTSPMPNLVIVPGVEQLAELDKKTTAAWVKAFFHDDVRSLWAESPKSPKGIAHGVWHWRLFCDEHWQPIVPRKEVYSREFTEAGWRSASQVLAEDGIVRLETEDGRIIETVVNAT